ncbi:ABC transporter permease [Lactococcus nasutitermitis]|uniref:ABC transporter permease n=1 Tax=Lactococcus nasutitermitis TaxID=1652957 RepID=A0ABV9JD26_9LACT|nr:ABC transporter permease [Lactococcus nasutitermitis]
MFKAELKRNLRESLNFYPDLLSNFFMTILLFCMFMVLGGAVASRNYMGYAFWFLLSGVVSEASISISYEKQRGTLEQLILKPISLIKILFIKSIIWGIFNLLQVVFATIVLCAIFSIKLNVTWVALLVLIVNFFGIIGFSMIFSALTLLFTKTASFLAIIGYLLLFASGALIPVERLPFFFKVLVYILPMNFGLNLIQRPFSLMQFMLLIAQTIFWIILGRWIFNLIYKRSKIKGLSTRY